MSADRYARPDWLDPRAPATPQRPRDRSPARAARPRDCRARCRALRPCPTRARRRRRRAALPARAAPAAAVAPGVDRAPAASSSPRCSCCSYGLVMAYSASTAQAYFNYGSSYYFFEQAAPVRRCSGVVAHASCCRALDYALVAARWRCPSPSGRRSLLVAVLVPGVGTVGQRRPALDHRRRPVASRPASSPSWPAVMLAAASSRRRPARCSSARRPRCVAAAIGIVPAAALIMLEPDLGTTLVLVMRRHRRARRRRRAPAPSVRTGCRCRPGVAVLIVVEPYRTGAPHHVPPPWKDCQGTGFQATQALISIASGHLFGVGLGNSVQKFGYLPEQTHRHDHRHHRRGARTHRPVLLVALLRVARLGGFRIALHLPASCSASCWPRPASPASSSVRRCINIGAALGLLPLTGVPLPLVSLGGTSLVVVLGRHRHPAQHRDQPEELHRCQP